MVPVSAGLPTAGPARLASRDRGDRPPNREHPGRFRCATVSGVEIIAPDPFAVLLDWLPGIPGRDGYFPVVSLATVGEDGGPDLRTLLISAIDNGRLSVHTDARSRKVTQLRADPRVAIALLLPETSRQVTLTGRAAPADPAESAVAYANRSRYLQLLAWTNDADTAASGEQERRQRWADFAAAHPDGTLTAPPDWIGFAITPDRITFWQGAADAPSHRTEYRCEGSGWTTAELPG